MVMERLYSGAGNAHIVGMTGPPGAGKSTLIDRMVSKLRARKQQVAVLAIDPSSPFSGGAVLGDRVRMGDHYSDPGVYIRSLSTRGSHGGLSRAARQIVTLLDAFKFDVIIVETAGVGQTELDIMDLAHTTVVVTVPEGGDGIQIMKAGLNEIADIFVVNKADRDGADRVKAELELNVHLRAANGWRPPVLLTQAANDRGIETLIRQLDLHREYLGAHSDPQIERQHRAREFVEILTGQIEERAKNALGNGRARELAESVGAGGLNPYTAARMLLDDPSAIGTLLSKTVVD
jgi:LAO/AO transport system kinase